MEFKAHRMPFLLAGPLVAAVTAVMITACGGGSAPSFAQGSGPGQWTPTEISEFMAATSSDGSGMDSCSAGYVERDMSFGNAMAVASLTPRSSEAQVEAAVVAKYGSAEGEAIYGQFQQAVSDTISSCES